MTQDPNASRGGQVLAVTIVFTSLAVLLTVLRYGTRLAIVRKFGYEDVSVGIATVSVRSTFARVARPTTVERI